MMDFIPKRQLLISVDESQASKKAFDWSIGNLYREGDKINLFHVVAPGMYIMPGTDVCVDNDEETRQRTAHATDFITKTYLIELEELKIPYEVEIVNFSTDCDSIGSMVCKRADQLNAAAAVLAKHNKGKVEEFFVGSVAKYCTQYCRSPVIVLHVD